MKRTEPEQIGALVNRLLKENNLDEKLLQQKAAFLWKDVVGEGINRYTTRRYVSGTVMHVYLSSAPLKNELLFMRDRLLKALNQAIGEPFLTDIQIH